MARSDNFMRIYEAYADAFPGEMPDHRGMDGNDFDNLEALMVTALERGSGITDEDLSEPVPEPDPDMGLVF